MIRIVVPGLPPRKNARGSIAGRARIIPKATREWMKRYDKALLDALMAKPFDRLAKSGKWRLCLNVYEKGQRHLDVSIPLGDIDSSVSVVLDAMQRGTWAVLDDDARVVSMAVNKHYDKANPRVEITLMEET